jgi:type I restriction enzyme, S subunit
MSDLRFVEKTKTTLSHVGFAQAREVRAGGVLFVCIGSTIGKVAQCARPCATNQQINAVIADAAFADDFIYYLLLIEAERIAKLAGKQAVPIINKTLFRR